MKRFPVCLSIVAVLLLGITPSLMAHESPRAFAEVDIPSAQPLKDAELQEFRAGAIDDNNVAVVPVATDGGGVFVITKGGGPGITWAYVNERLKNQGDLGDRLIVTTTTPYLYLPYVLSNDQTRNEIANFSAEVLKAAFTTYGAPSGIHVIDARNPFGVTR
jgi:hypothetical protein